MKRTNRIDVRLDEAESKKMICFEVVPRGPI